MFCVCVSVWVCVCLYMCANVSCGLCVCVCVCVCVWESVILHVLLPMCPASLCLPYNVSMRMCVCESLPSHPLPSGYYDTAMPCTYTRTHTHTHTHACRMVKQLWTWLDLMIKTPAFDALNRWCRAGGQGWRSRCIHTSMSVFMWVQ